ncbi:MAG TPA: hypothetical protein ENJ60_03435 [Aeromonadales bacterium]|nr:hypothetical protein [Aeromonadales bacterium]
MSQKTSVAVLVSAVVTLMGINIQLKPIYASSLTLPNQSKIVDNKTSIKKNKSFVRNRLPQKLDMDEGISGEQRFIVRLKDQSIVSYDGHIPGYPATRLNLNLANSTLKPVSGNAGKLPKIDFSSTNVKAYAHFLQKKQDSVEKKSVA